MAASIDNPNPLIGRNALQDETFGITVGHWNIANAVRDEANNPLKPRIPRIIETINKANPPLDVLVLLEAGRASQGSAWTQMAFEIEKGIGMHYMGIDYPNGTANPFGKAIFIRRSTCAISGSRQTWLDKQGHKFAGPQFGCDVTTFRVSPVVDEYLLVDGRPKPVSPVIRDIGFTLSFVHLPMDQKARLDCAEILSGYHDSCLIMGDWNTFYKKGDTEMYSEMSQRCWSHLTKDVFTFQAFSHDTTHVPAEEKETINAESKIVSANDDGSFEVLFTSSLDHVFVHPEYMHSVVQVSPPDHSASDHSLVAVHLKSSGY